MDLGQVRRTSSSCAVCWVASREGQQGVHSEPQGNCRPAVDRAFLADTFDVLPIQMYRNAVDVLESFGSSRPGDKPPPPRTEDLRASHVPVLQERLSPADTLLQGHEFALGGDGLALFRLHSANRFEREDAGCAIQRTTLHERRSLLRSCTLWDDALPAALGTFGVQSQAGDKMQQSSTVTVKTILDEDARKAVEAWVARFTGQGVVLSVLAKNCDCQTDPRPSLHGGTLCDSICGTVLLQRRVQP